MSGDKTTDSGLKGSFGGLSGVQEPASVPGFAHPESDAILEEAMAILAQIPAGKRLLDVKVEYNMPVTVIMGREFNYNTPDETSLYVMVPPDYKKKPELTATALANGIRDLEQSVIGFTRPAKEIDPVEYASMTFSKSLDIIMNMCIIADELKEKLGYSKPLDFLFDLGQYNVYKAYKADADYNEIVDIFVEGEKEAYEGN